MDFLVSLLPFAGFLLGLLTALAGLFAYYKNSLKKSYAAERDFQHLKRNQEQMVQMLLQLDDSIDGLRIEIVRITSKLL